MSAALSDATNGQALAEPPAKKAKISATVALPPASDNPKPDTLATPNVTDQPEEPRLATIDDAVASRSLKRWILEMALGAALQAGASLDSGKVSPAALSTARCRVTRVAPATTAILPSHVVRTPVPSHHAHIPPAPTR